MTELNTLLQSLQGRRVGVVGGGLSGVAAAKLLVQKGARVLLSDSAKTLTPIDGVTLELGGHTEALLEQELVVLSPGVDPRHPILSRITAPICGELELAYQLLPRKPIVAITGTNGKTTTTSLIGHILREAGKSVFVGGNIGQPFSAMTGDPDVVVLEVSSYQCEGLRTFDADVCVYLNLTPDHLDRYASVDAYAAAKERLFSLSHGLAVLNAEDAFVMRAASAHPGRVVTFTSQNPPAFDLQRGKLRGAHNRQNQTAAILAVEALGVSPDHIQRGLDSFPGVKHRIEHCGTVDGVDYYNDSKATNDDAAAKALASFPGPIIWLAGGRDKGGGYALSVAEARGKMKAAIVFGEAKSLIADAFASVAPVHTVDSLTDAVARAHAEAKPGDVVLLSPACSSWDQFKNYEERGNLFKQLVAKL